MVVGLILINGGNLLMREYVVIHSCRMAGWLMYHGVMFKFIQSDKKNKLRKVFIFDKTDKLIELMGQYNYNNSSQNTIY